MDFITQVIPAFFVMFANLAGGEHGSEKYEVWTAIFGWTAGVSMVLVFLSLWIWPIATPYLIQISGFSLLTALTRDYEKLLKPLFLYKKRNPKNDKTASEE